MSLKYAVVVLILLIGVMGIAGCTGTSPAPAVSSPPPSVAVPVASTPAPAGTPGVVAPPSPTAVAWTTVPAPVPDHPSSKTYTFEGTGDYTQEFTTDSSRTWVFRMSSPAKEIFLVKIMDDHGDDIDVLADASDVYAGTESVWLNAGTYYLDVAADSPWTITMSTS